MTVPAYRLEAKLKNNRLWHAILAIYPEAQSQAAAARALRVRPDELGELLNMRRYPRNRRTGEWLQLAVRIAKALYQEEEYLFDRTLYGFPPERAILELDRPALEGTGMLQLPESPMDVVEREEAQQALADAIATLSPREATILRHRYGLDTGHSKTLEEVAALEGVSRNRIRQIEQKTMRKLRHPSRIQILCGEGALNTVAHAPR